ncbi:3-deoxy-D-manno-octulosonic-acid transferase [Rhodobacter aestuarii]|uniref:3-deoxy-D-manno-octulosonic acid transferase n=1 Tax=Rhodobacter aestuarii TaxID=453582 RepID=A0A1N7Q9G2_9RHOB|nr:glycosyltransferase N-terminal domain-containing protein [Rhodobacter aestuarii]PTV93783.1 3-deoxy-D-manno-octulosonic-acid transferase [Rhodobacter aestuarii]SIT19502.1 3-deoxy-D-manno-octulosonic-acid transferase [Rhodobacter aestuarii]
MTKDAVIRAAYQAAGWALAPLAPVVLKRRLAKGRELPDRWREKLGHATLPRPKGRLVWLHAVGLGETMALRGLIKALAQQAPDLEFLITSGTRGSAEVIARDMPPNARHQFLPLDSPPFLNRFLHHWQPDLAIWSEQDIWPGAIFATQTHGIPQALVNARMAKRSYEGRARLGSLYRAAFACLRVIDAQDPTTAQYLSKLGAQGVSVSGSLKPAAPPLGTDPAEFSKLKAALAGRRVWVAASSHAGDQAEALAALEATSDSLLIIAPRFLNRADAIAADLRARNLPFARRSADEVPGPETRVWLADTLGEMGLWYRLADWALVGGGFDAIGGHNPWEAVNLGCPVLHGPDTANFVTDYAALEAIGAARQVAPGTLASALPAPSEAAEMATKAKALVQDAQQKVQTLAARLLALMEAQSCR